MILILIWRCMWVLGPTPLTTNTQGPTLRGKFLLFKFPDSNIAKNCLFTFFCPQSQFVLIILIFHFCHMSSAPGSSDGRGPVTRKRVPDREEQGKPRKDARHDRCHPLE
jgi:hypothetical protein